MRRVSSDRLISSPEKENKNGRVRAAGLEQVRN